MKYVKRNALADQAFDVLRRARAAPGRVDGRWPISACHGTTHEAPIVRFERDERAALRPLPVRPLPRRSSACAGAWRIDAFVDVDTVRYSVPYRLVRDHVDVVVEEQIVRIFHGATLVATHARSHEPFARVVDPTHYAGLWRVGAATRPPTPALASLGRDLADYAAVVGRWPMSVVIHARVVEQLTRLRLRLRRRAARCGAQ